MSFVLAVHCDTADTLRWDCYVPFYFGSRGSVILADSTHMNRTYNEIFV